MIEQGTQLSSLQKLLSPAWGHLNPSPIVRGAGVYVFDSGGKRFLDLTCGIGVTATGHCHSNGINAIFFAGSIPFTT